MSFISYAQNQEDVMLYRALKHIPKGFYIDVGANDPVEDSLTKAFYDIGWCGINIEPQQDYYELLKQQRPNDTNLNIAISSSQKEIEFYISHIRGWSTTRLSTINEDKKDYFSLTPLIIQALTLDEVIEKNNIQEIHFLKIDVEGAEKDVLLSFSFSIKPWIIVIEATLQGTNIDNSKEYQDIILHQGYTFAYFDGINNFYISPLHPELLEFFAYPPNVLDDFLTYPLYHTLQVCEEQTKVITNLHQTIDTLSSKLQEMDLRLKETDSRLQNYMQLYYMVVNSRSWKITYPLRAITSYIKTIIKK